MSPQNAKKCVGGRGSVPDPAGGAYSAPPDPLAGKGGGAPREGGGRGRKGKGREGREGEGSEGRGRAIPQTEILATALFETLKSGATYVSDNRTSLMHGCKKNSYDLKPAAMSVSILKLAK